MRKTRVVHMNPSVTRHGDSLLLIERVNHLESGSPTHNWRHNFSHLRLSRFNPKLKGGKAELLTLWEEHPDDARSREDPRLFVRDGQVEIWCARRSPRDPFGPVWQEIIRLNDAYRIEEVLLPTNFRNGAVRYQKNWTPMEGTSCFSYWLDGVHVVGTLDDVSANFQSTGLFWDYGQIHLGTPSLLIGDSFLAFFQSSREEPYLDALASRGIYNKRYYLGAVEFASTPPFSPITWTPEPLLIGSIKNPTQWGSPPVLFPGGAVQTDSQILVSLGINDCGWSLVEISLDQLRLRMQPVPESPQKD
jgi:predicted GH43/DUF377 family glycosyl hydrolase